MNSLDNFVDFTLTPRNAKDRGFMYVKDIIIPAKKDTSMDSFLTLLAIHQFKIGIPEKINNAHYGLFVPESELKRLAELSKKINHQK